MKHKVSKEVVTEASETAAPPQPMRTEIPEGMYVLAALDDPASPGSGTPARGLFTHSIRNPLESEIAGGTGQGICQEIDEISGRRTRYPGGRKL